MPRPERPDRLNYLLPLLRCLGDNPMEHSRAEIPPVQDHITNEHEADDGEPYHNHTDPLSSSAGPVVDRTRCSRFPAITRSSRRRAILLRIIISLFGPWLISRPTKKR